MSVPKLLILEHGIERAKRIGQIAFNENRFTKPSTQNAIQNNASHLRLLDAARDLANVDFPLSKVDSDDTNAAKTFLSDYACFRFIDERVFANDGSVSVAVEQAPR